MGFDLGSLAGKVVEAALGKGTIEALIERFLPKSMDEAERKKLEFEIEQFRTNAQAQAEKALMDSEAAFRQSVNEFENPAGLDQKTLAYRARVRPNLTYASFGLMAVIIVSTMFFGQRIPWEKLKDVPEPIWLLLGATWTFWFGGRSIADAKFGKNQP